MTKFLTLFYFNLLTMATSAIYAQHVETAAKEYFDLVREGSSASFPKAFLTAENENTTLNALRHFRLDSSYMVRSKAYELTFLISSRSANDVVRRKGVDILLGAYRNENLELSGLALDLLKQFMKEDFTVAAKDTLRKMVKAEGVHFDRVIRLAGFLDLTDLITDIRPWSQPGNRFAIRWAAMLTLARLHDQFAVAEIMKQVKKLPVNDDLVYQVFPDLIYTRQPELIAYMVKALHSDAMNCLSADAENERSIACGYRIMEQLAPVIQGFPLVLDESGDLQTNDYQAALESVRQWFNANKNYTILNNRY